MSRKRQRAGLFNHATAIKKKSESEKGHVVRKAGSYLHICFKVNTDARYLTKLVQKVGLERQAEYCKPTMKVCPLMCLTWHIMN